MSLLDALPAPAPDPVVFGPPQRTWTDDEVWALQLAATATVYHHCCGVLGTGATCWRCGRRRSGSIASD